MANENKAAPEISLTLGDKRYEFKWTIQSGKEFARYTGKDLLLGHKIDLTNSKDLYFYFWAGLLCNKNPELTPEYVGRQMRFLMDPIVLSGKQYEFCFSLYSIYEFYALTEVDLLTVPKNFKADINVLSAFLFAGLSTVHTEMTIAQCDEIAELGQLTKAFAKVQHHLQNGGTDEMAGLFLKALDGASPTEAQKKSLPIEQKHQQKRKKPAAGKKKKARA